MELDHDITSLQNPKIKQTLRLRERRDRDESGEFLIEGFRELKRASEGGQKIATLFVCEELFLGENERGLIADIRKQGAQLFTCAPRVFEKLSYRDRSD